MGIIKENEWIFIKKDCLIIAKIDEDNKFSIMKTKEISNWSHIFITSTIEQLFNWVENNDVRRKIVIEFMNIITLMDKYMEEWSRHGGNTFSKLLKINTDLLVLYGIILDKEKIYNIEFIKLKLKQLEITNMIINKILKKPGKICIFQYQDEKYEHIDYNQLFSTEQVKKDREIFINSIKNINQMADLLT